MPKDGINVLGSESDKGNHNERYITIVFVNVPEEYLLDFGCFAVTGADKMDAVKARIFGELRHRLLSLLSIPTMPD